MRVASTLLVVSLVLAACSSSPTPDARTTPEKAPATLILPDGTQQQVMVTSPGGQVIAEAVLSTVLMLAPGSMPVDPPQPTASVSDPDQTGKQPSAYEGRKYRPEHEQFRLCVAQREGRFQYGVTGSNGFYESTYQMTDALVRGANPTNAAWR